MLFLSNGLPHGIVSRICFSINTLHDLLDLVSIDLVSKSHLQEMNCNDSEYVHLPFVVGCNLDVMLQLRLLRVNQCIRVCCQFSLN